MGARIGGLGNVLLFMQTATGMLLFVICPLILFILWDIWHRHKLDKEEAALSLIHISASAVKVGLKRREENPEYTGEEPFNYFLSVLFPDEQLMILPYNRVVKDLNGLDEADFLAAVGEHFTVEKMDGPYTPDEKGLFGMYLGGSWYKLAAGAECRSYDPVKRCV